LSPISVENGSQVSKGGNLFQRVFFGKPKVQLFVPQVMSKYVEFHTVFIDLGQLGRCRNGKCKGEGGLPLTPRSLLPTPRLGHFWLLFERLDVAPYL
jgi:hypothetical protein